MNSRFRDRLEQLEAKIAPKAIALVFLSFEEPNSPPRADRLAAFRAENGLGPSDPVHEVSVTFS
jgi:hypothetical protein